MSVALKSVVPGDYIDFGRKVEPTLLRGALPMAVVGLIVVIALAATGRLRRVWRDQKDLPRPPIWMRLLIIIPIAVTIAGLVRRVVQFNSTGPALLGAILVLVLVVGFTEELIFRGWVITELRDRGFGEMHVMWISALLFGAWHLPNILLGQNVGQVLTQFALTTLTGLIDYAVRRTTRRLWPLMVLHAGWDFAVL
ncbi:CPBP family intramembrane glutamic endopeptidase [Enemella sp. A6]|uniref:CPBP family intramembrane glutamic endopeptidase n=1 Tax=Enemella sp. A6 TaxID=3440152 RepID=UPI003EBED5E7